mmetsp:Transcript_15847/g.42637  ORF Transcript_15847/g.42637 Transcript_15847/m.42637 type:complete len:229 (-) Transcript_15847:2179-2865(-)
MTSSPTWRVCTPRRSSTRVRWCVRARWTSAHWPSSTPQAASWWSTGQARACTACPRGPWCARATTRAPRPSSARDPLFTRPSSSWCPWATTLRWWSRRTWSASSPRSAPCARTLLTTASSPRTRRRSSSAGGASTRPSPPRPRSWSILLQRSCPCARLVRPQARCCARFRGASCWTRTPQPREVSTWGVSLAPPARLWRASSRPWRTARVVAGAGLLLTTLWWTRWVS